MFGFANFLLLALFAAAAVDLIGAWRRCGRPVPALRVLWREEHLLFGGWAAARRLQWGPRLFCLGLALYEFTVVFCNSMAREQWPWVQARLAPVLDVVMYLAFFGKILLGTRYSWRSLGLAGALYFIARWVYFNGQNIWFLGLAVVLLAAKDVPLRRSMRAFLASGLPALALVEVLHFAGLIAPGATSERDGSFRLLFGYGHPNTFGGVVLGLVLAWVLLRLGRLRWLELAATFLPVFGVIALFATLGRQPDPAAVRYQGGALGQRHRPRLAAAPGRAADLPHLPCLGRLPGAGHQNCRSDAARLAGAGQHFRLPALPVRPGPSGHCRHAADRCALPVCPARPLAGGRLPGRNAVVWVYGDPGAARHQRPGPAAAQRRCLCAALLAVERSGYFLPLTIPIR